MGGSSSSSSSLRAKCIWAVRHFNPPWTMVRIFGPFFLARLKKGTTMKSSITYKNLSQMDKGHNYVPQIGRAYYPPDVARKILIPNLLSRIHLTAPVHFAKELARGSRWNSSSASVRVRRIIDKNEKYCNQKTSTSETYFDCSQVVAAVCPRKSKSLSCSLSMSGCIPTFCLL